MKVLFIAKYPQWYRLAWGGDQHSHVLAEYLAKKNHEVYFLNAIYEGNNNMKFKKMNYKSYRDRPFYPKADQLIDILQDQKFDIVHHFSTMGYSFEQLKSKKEVNFPSICSIWTLRTAAAGINKDWKFLFHGKPFRYLAIRKEKFAAKSANIVTVASTAMRELVSKEFNIPAEKIRKIPRGVDTHFFKLQPWPIRKDKIILAVARLEKEKGVQYLIESMPQILKVVSNASLRIVGAGKDEKFLRRLVHKLQLEKSVKFIGKVDRSRMPAFYKECNVFVLYSLFEPFGAVLTEAGSSGRPVIAPNCGGPQDIILDGKTGFLVKPFDFQALIDKIIEVLTNDELSKKMGEVGRQHILQNFTWASEAKSYDRLYKELAIST